MFVNADINHIGISNPEQQPDMLLQDKCEVATYPSFPLHVPKLHLSPDCLLAVLEFVPVIGRQKSGPAECYQYRHSCFG